MDMQFCPACDAWFNNSDGTGVCTQGHEPVTDDEYPVAAVEI